MYGSDIYFERIRLMLLTDHQTTKITPIIVVIAVRYSNKSFLVRRDQLTLTASGKK